MFFEQQALPRDNDKCNIKKWVRKDHPPPLSFNSFYKTGHLVGQPLRRFCDICYDLGTKRVGDRENLISLLVSRAVRVLFTSFSFSTTNPHIPFSLPHVRFFSIFLLCSSLLRKPDVYGAERPSSKFQNSFPFY